LRPPAIAGQQGVDSDPRPDANGGVELLGLFIELVHAADDVLERLLRCAGIVLRTVLIDAADLPLVLARVENLLRLLVRRAAWLR
jgi:hypothetical protein